MGYLFSFKDGEREICAWMHSLSVPVPRPHGNAWEKNQPLQEETQPEALPDADGEALEVVLFRALVDIDVGTELTSGLRRQPEVLPRRRPGSALAGR